MKNEKLNAGGGGGHHGGGHGHGWWGGGYGYPYPYYGYPSPYCDWENGTCGILNADGLDGSEDIERFSNPHIIRNLNCDGGDCSKCPKLSADACCQEFTAPSTGGGIAGNWGNQR